MTQLANVVTWTEEREPAAVGMGATVCYYTDRQACTVIWVSPSGKTSRLQDDEAIRTDRNGMSDAQQYRYAPNPAGTIRTARLTRRGWRSGGSKVLIGVRDQHYDYSF